MSRLYILLALALLLPLTAAMANEPWAETHFVNLHDGDIIKNPVHVVFGIQGMTISPAGSTEPNTGHFHLLIDTTLSPEEQKFAIPKDNRHLHFGKGETETTFTLPPGPHTLQLVMGDGNHELHNPPVMSPVIHIRVTP